MLKAILKYRHGSKNERLKNVTKPWSCEASRYHEVPWYINAEPSRVFEKAVDFRAKIKISVDEKNGIYYNTDDCR